MSGAWTKVGPRLLAALEAAEPWIGRVPVKSDMADYAQMRVAVLNAIELGAAAELVGCDDDLVILEEGQL